jgi:hypothetical protein
MTHNRVDTEAAARKRQEIGLTPRRATASDAVERPPDKAVATRTPNWVFVSLTGALALVLFAFVLSRMVGSTGFASDSESVTWFNSAPVDVQTASAVRSFSNDFSTDADPLVRDLEPDRWSMGVVEDEGVYRIRMWPGVLAWSSTGAGAISNYRLSTRFSISEDAPWGYAGLIARYSDEQNLYLVQVDGKGRFRVQVQDNGAWQLLQDWTQTLALLPAGEFNELVLEDRPDLVRLYANGVQVFESNGVWLPAGDVGVMAGTLDDQIAEANFDSLTLQPLPAE